MEEMAPLQSGRQHSGRWGAASWAVLACVGCALLMISQHLGVGGGFQAAGEAGQVSLMQPIVINDVVQAKTAADAAHKAASNHAIPIQETGPWHGHNCEGDQCATAKVADSISKQARGVAMNFAHNFLGGIFQPLADSYQWRNYQTPTASGYKFSAQGAPCVPACMGCPCSGGHRVPVQVNAKIVFPNKGAHKVAKNPCAEKGGSGCEGGQQEMYSEHDMKVRLNAERERADERLVDARKNWEDELLERKERWRERIQSLKQRKDAIANQIRSLEAGGGRRMDLPQYIRVRNRVAGMSDAVAKLIADENVLQTRIDHVLATPGATGPAGQMGLQGAQGLRGVQGPRGLTGPPGLPGANGLPGADGPRGPQGPPGVRGPPGNNGANGANGPRGQPGPMGDQGQQGPPGFEGVPGKDGAPGKNGLNGKQGPPGAPGKDGKDGVDGTPGARGPSGANGPPGNAGRDGLPGPPGLSGPIGARGPQGPQGPTGPSGVNGAAGPPGPRGDPGPMGPTGYDGYIGKPGRDGAPGAPRLAVEPPSPPLPVPAPPGAPAPGVGVHMQTVVKTVSAYTPVQYNPIISAAIAQAVKSGCPCAAATTVVALQQKCPCVQQHYAATQAQGDAHKQSLTQVDNAPPATFH